MNSSVHAIQRVADRLAASGIEPDEAERIHRTAEAFASKCSAFESVAVRIRAVAFVGQSWSNTSNGDTIVAVIRGRMVTTFMFRRRTQPFDRASLSVDRVVTL